MLRRTIACRVSWLFTKCTTHHPRFTGSGEDGDSTTDELKSSDGNVKSKEWQQAHERAREECVVRGSFKKARMCIAGPTNSIHQLRGVTITDLEKKEEGWRKASVVVEVPTLKSSVDVRGSSGTHITSKEFKEDRFLAHCKDSIVVTAADYDPLFTPAQSNKKQVSAIIFAEKRDRMCTANVFSVNATIATSSLSLRMMSS